MRKALKVLGIIFAVLVLIVLAGFVYFNSSYPNAGPVPKVKIELTKQRIERGEYLANHVTVCMDCHSTRDWSHYGGPMVPGTEGIGGERYGKELGLPGDVYSKNITPYHLGTWTDGEILHAITTGINKKGQALFPLMPYQNFSKMSEEDLYSVIAYIRTLKPVKSDPPESELDFPMNMIVKTIPQPYVPVKSAPDKSNPKEYGKYLVTIAGCNDCHTQAVKGEPKPGMQLAGGTEFMLPWGTVRTANITPDKETGIGNWTKDDFLNRFKTYRNDDAFMKVSMNEFNTVMPWSFFAGMTDEDLGAIFEYLSSVTPVKNQVIRYTPPMGTKQASVQ